MLANLPRFHILGLTVTLWTPLYFGMTVISYPNPLDYKAICDIVREERPTIMVGTPSFYRGYLKKSNSGDFESGATETSPVISVNTPERNKPGSVGRCLPNLMIKIEDCEKKGVMCGPCRTGRIPVKGSSVIRGYPGSWGWRTSEVR
jgi:acyl-[acyl-carrier-protein]-phospholipid O-acyltransferase/long-chain-fatty-acid--[acyl-carrier-protein] ligase